MRSNPAMYRYFTLLAALLAHLYAGSVTAAVPSLQHPRISDDGIVQPVIIILAENETAQDTGARPESGTLVLPAAAEQPAEQEKKCMTVCGRWGEECMFINRGAGGMTKKCRRACKKFVEECF